MRRDDQDWGAIFKSQAEANQFEQLEKKRLAEQRKKQYKEELDQQVLLKQQIRSAPSDRFRLAESQANSQINSSNEIIYQNPSDRFSSNKTVAGDYRREIEFKNQQADQERYQSMLQAREMNQQLQNAIEREKQAERENKLKQIAWSREEMRRNEELKGMKRLQDDEERFRDRETLERRIEENARKEQHFKAVRNNGQHGLFEPEMETMQSYQQRAAYKDKNDKMMKEKAQQDTKDALALYMQNQDMKKNEERDRMQSERDEMESQVQYFKAQEEFEKEQKKRLIQEYRSQLEIQKNFAMEGRLNDEQLNSREKMLIGNLYNGKSIEATSDIDNSVIPLGVYNKPLSSMPVRSILLDSPISRTSSAYSSHDPNKHNTILNPIGVAKPRGKQLSKLAQAGTSIFG